MILLGEASPSLGRRHQLFDNLQDSPASSGTSADSFSNPVAPACPRTSQRHKNFGASLEAKLYLIRELSHDEDPSSMIQQQVLAYRRVGNSKVIKP